MRFHRVQSRKVSAIAAEQIVEAIHRGDFPVGSRLPSCLLYTSPSPRD